MSVDVDVEGALPLIVVMNSAEDDVLEEMVG